VVLALWGIVGSVGSPTATLLNGAGVLKVITIVSVFVGITNIALSIYLTRRVGVIGVCLGSIITQLLITYPTCFFLIRNMFIRLAKAKQEDRTYEVTLLE
jgi:O-antigen/teichoic acid export membrane protein